MHGKRHKAQRETGGSIDFLHTCFHRDFWMQMKIFRSGLRENLLQLCAQMHFSASLKASRLRSISDTPSNCGKVLKPLWMYAHLQCHFSELCSVDEGAVQR